LQTFRDRHPQENRNPRLEIRDKSEASMNKGSKPAGHLIARLQGADAKERSHRNPAIKQSRNPPLLLPAGQHHVVCRAATDGSVRMFRTIPEQSQSLAKAACLETPLREASCHRNYRRYRLCASIGPQGQVAQGRRWCHVFTFHIRLRRLQNLLRRFCKRSIQKPEVRIQNRNQFIRNVLYKF